MAFTRSLTFQIDSSGQYTSTLEFLDSGPVQLTVVGPGINETALWEFDETAKTMQFIAGPATLAVAGCIITCLGVAVGKALLACLLKSKTRQEIETCLRGKAADALADAVACVAACLGIV